MIYCVGSINLDCVARVVRLPKPGETVSGTAYAEAPGGKGANQALAARRAGARVAMIGCTGNDNQADTALALLRDARVDLAAVTRIAKVSTGLAMILVDDGTGENQIAVVPGANAHVLQDGAGPPLTSADSVMAQLEIPAPAVEIALKAAARAGAASYLNIAPFNDAAAGLAPLADVVIANETEFDSLSRALGLSGTTREESLERMRAVLSAVIVLTLGANGAVAATDDGLLRAKAPTITPVDTVGAGDTFCGYLAAARAETMGWPDALDLACRAGALACLAEGAQPAIPERAAVDDFNDGA